MFWQFLRDHHPTWGGFDNFGNRVTFIIKTVNPCFNLSVNGHNTVIKCMLDFRHCGKNHTFTWGALKPALSARTREKVSISSGVPNALRDALGGPAALEKMLRSVPDSLPVPEASQAGGAAAEPSSAPESPPASPA